VGSDVLLGIGLIVIAGIGLQWLAALLRLPSIILLLVGGMLLGPLLGAVEPKAIFGDSLFTVVSLGVAFLLFLGGLALDLNDLGRGIRRPVFRLVSIGMLVTWGLTTFTVHNLFHEPRRLSALLGAILVVSGPTVVEPLLHLARPAPPVSTILRWEGILIDPIGATLGLFCLNAFFVNEFSARAVWGQFIFVMLAGAVVGFVIGGLLVAALRAFIVPDQLTIAVVVMFVVGAYLLGEVVRPEAGLFATTVMGLVLANQRFVPVRSLRIFGEPLVAFLIGSLFIVLASQVEPRLLLDHLGRTCILVAVLVLVVRPISVAVSTVGVRSLDWRQRAFLACLAPRGIVAASTAALYSLRLAQLGQDNASLIPVTFSVIIALAVLYGLGSVPAARRLGVAPPVPRGVVLVGAASWVVELAAELTHQGVPTLLVARGRSDLSARDDLPYRVHTGLVHELDDAELLADMSGAIVASEDDETNLVALGVILENLPRGRVWLLPGDHRRNEPPNVVAEVEQWTRAPFTEGTTHTTLDDAVAAGHRVRTVPIASMSPDSIMLVRLRPDGTWTAAAEDRRVSDRVVVLDGASTDPDEPASPAG
jgi:NhaP-type Na+/H+ or K+/H+ antiporter